jgi:dihydrodipicolinate synthase/N-acetylneuraminate lyase
MHVGAPTTLRAARLAEHAAKAGVEAICCVPPFFYRQSDDAVVEHYRVVAAAANLPFFVYNLPQSTNVEITPELMTKIQEKVPQLAGLKHSAPYMGYVRNFAQMGLACLIGNCRLMLPALTIGATGCVDGPPNLAPERWVALWRAYQAGDLAKAQAAQEHASQVADLAPPFKFHATAKAVLSARLGIDCGEPRQPGQPLTAGEQADLMGKIRKLGLVG